MKERKGRGEKGEEGRDKKDLRGRIGLQDRIDLLDKIGQDKNGVRGRIEFQGKIGLRGRIEKQGEIIGHSEQTGTEQHSNRSVLKGELGMSQAVTKKKKMILILEHQETNLLKSRLKRRNVTLVETESSNLSLPLMKMKWRKRMSLSPLLPKNKKQLKQEKSQPLSLVMTN